MKIKFYYIIILVLLVIVLGIGFLFWKNQHQTNNTTTAINHPGTCYIGGCSSQICSDQKDVVSTCEYREEYGCYKTTSCKRQTNGECGWTQTPELNACLNKLN